MRINQEDGETSSLQDRGEQPVSTSPGQEPTGPSPEGLREERGGDKPAEGETGGKGNEEEANEQDTLPDLEQSKRKKHKWCFVFLKINQSCLLSPQCLSTISL